MRIGIPDFVAKRRLRLASFPIIVFILGAASNLSAQRQANLHPAENFGFWLSRLNPAAMSFQNGRLVVGTEILHAGFIPDRAFGLNEHRLHLTFPYWLPWDLAVGCEARSFNAPLYSEIEAGILLSRKILPQLALGLKLSMESRAFDRSRFNLSDPNDPLLREFGARRTIANFGMSMYWREGAWTAGASVARLNQPNLALAARAMQPRVLALGVAYDLGLVAPSVTWNDDGVQRFYGVSVAANVSKLAALRCGYEQSGPLRLEAQFNLQRNDKFSYGLSLPAGEISAASNGTHALVYEHTISREPEIGAPLLRLSTQHLNIMCARFKRIMEAAITPEALNNLPGMTAEYVDPNLRRGNRIIVPLIGLDEQMPQERRHDSYHELSRGLGALLPENSQSEIAVRVATGESAQARAFEKIFRQHWRGSAPRLFVQHQKTRGQVFLHAFRAGKTVAQDQPPVLSHENLVITIAAAGNKRTVGAWELHIFAPNAKAVKSFTGTGKLPTTLVWDWRNDDGELASTGQYRCVLSVTSKTGKKHETRADLEITRTQREATVRIAKMPRANLPQSMRSASGTRQNNL